MAFDDDTIAFRVVRNGEDIYSIWPLHRPVPAGWFEVGFSGTKAACLEHVETVWTDMRPLSLRRAMDQDEGARR